jgi:hypothetical protein
VTVAFVFVVLSGLAPAAEAQPIIPNPPWPSHCPLRLGLVIDRSSSMADRFDEVREAASNVVDSLRDKPSEVTIIGFGTGAEVLSSDVDVSDEDARHELKDQIRDLQTYGGDDSATNWEAAIVAASGSRLDIVILVTDGLPNAYGNPVRQGPEAVTAAVAAADRLKSGGTRLTAVGIDLQSDGAKNLEFITGPTRGEDYYPTDTAGLLRQLYGIVASSCGVPLAALPQPEPPEFPWLQAILGTLGALLVLGLAAFTVYRRRALAAGAPAAARSARPATSGSPAIDHSDLARQLRDNRPTPPTTKDSP